MALAPRPTLRLALVGLLLAPAVARATFVTFESGEVRPLALSPDGSKLFAVDTPDDRLEIFNVNSTDGTLTHNDPLHDSVPVGLEPVAVAARTNTEVWVVNHLSDSVSIVNLSGPEPRVTRTLLVGDEPRDIVFAMGGTRAFITCAHRGQQRSDTSLTGVPGSGDPQLITPGVDRADVWVFDATALDGPGSPPPTLGGKPLSIVTLFGDTPRALAVSPDGKTVYAAVFHSGNQTTAISEGVVCNGGSGAGSCTVGGVTYPGGLPAPNTDANNNTGPETGLVIKFTGSSQATGHWQDQLGRNWDNAVRFFLPDDDVFQIDATQNPPAAKPSSPHAGQPFAHVGTVLFNLAVNPVSGHVYVSNTDAHNEVRFEGQRSPCASPSSVVGHLSEARITVLDPGSGAVTPRHLNSHLDSGPSSYCTVPSPAGTADKSLATPVGMAVSSDGSTLYVAAFGSSDPANPLTTGKVGVFSTSALESGSFTPSAASHIVVSGGGASGVVLDDTKHRLYVLTRFDNAVSVVDTTASTEIQHVAIFNPEPAVVKNGRPFLYDANLTASNGEAACASCHIFADFDSLAWDLGNPGDVRVTDTNPFRNPPGDGGLATNPGFHPLKGPMTTQTLRGMVNDGPMHWRGDRTGGGGQALNSTLAFEAFNVAFPGLLGMAGHCSVTTAQSCHGPSDCPSGQKCVGLSDTDMAAFTQFILQVTLPPNPVRALDNSLTAGDQQDGHDFFQTVTSDIVQTCDGCHVLNASQKHFGTDGLSTFENETQDFKIPHLRNLYQKVGMFGMPAIQFINAGNNGTAGPPSTQPDQVRGFGFLHDGSVDTLLRFHNATVFNTGFSNNFRGSTGDPLRRKVEQFMLAFDSDLAPIVGQQITLTNSNASAVGSRISLLIARANAGECDLTAKGVIKNPITTMLEQRGALWLPAEAKFETDRVSDAHLTDAQVRALAATAGQEITYTCVPPGDGVRVGIDRDQDGFRDRDELDAGSDPADPNSIPGSSTTTTTSTTTSSIVTTTSTTTSTLPLVLIETQTLSLLDSANAAKRRISFRSVTPITLPPPNGNTDPTVVNATLTVYNPGSGEKVVVNLPSMDGVTRSAWSHIGAPGHFKGYRFRGKDPAGPISSVVVQARKLIVKGGKQNWGYTLTAPSQGRIALRLTFGTAGWCADTHAKMSGNPASTANNDKVGKYVAQPQTSPPLACPPTPP